MNPATPLKALTAACILTMNSATMNPATPLKALEENFGTIAKLTVQGVKIHSSETDFYSGGA
jgi:hypothetical protein